MNKGAYFYSLGASPTWLVEEGQISAEERQQMASQIPYGRPVRPDEIGKTVAWLVGTAR